MGDLVLGVAKTVVEGTLVRAKSAIDEEAKLKASVQRDLVFISGEFQMMQCFLNITDEERAKNAVVKTWVRQLRDLAYDVEDCIEFVVHLEKKSAWWWRVVPSCMAPALPLDVAVANIKEVKERVVDVSQRNMRYNLNLAGDPGSGSKPPAIAQVTTAGGARQFDMLAQAMDAAKKQHGFWDLGELIIRQDRDLQVISLWGTTTSDLGMKSIISKVYDDPETCQAFVCRAWVKLAHPFNPHEFIRSLLAQFFADSCPEKQQTVVGVDVLKMMKTAAAGAEEEHLMEEFVRRVHRHRYLVVLENLCSMVDWRTAKTYLPDMKNGSRILVSTQQFEIASLCTGHPYNISEISQFSAHHSVCILFKEGSQHDEEKCQDEVGGIHRLESEAAHILDMLKGVDNEIRRNNKSLVFHVMSVWGVAGVGKSALVRSIYLGQMGRKYSHRWGKYAWVNVEAHAFDLDNFCQSLFWDLRSIRTKAEEEECCGRYSTFESQCLAILREHRCLLVIDGLESIEQWDKIYTALRLEAAKGRIIVITREESVAIHCADTDSFVCKVQVSEYDDVCHLSNNQGSQCDNGTHQDEFIHTVAPRHDDNIHLLGRQSEVSTILNILDMVYLESRGYELNSVSFYVMSVWGIAGVGKTSLVRSIYFDQMKVMYNHRWSKQGWANVPHPFNLREFCRSLLLDLSSESASGKAKDYFCISSTEDPIKECRDILRVHQCLIVIDNLESNEEWDLINSALGLRSCNTRTIVITNDANIATHCAEEEILVYNIRSIQPDAALQLYKDQAAELTFHMSPEIMKEVDLILTKCGGIPKHSEDDGDDPGRIHGLEFQRQGLHMLQKLKKDCVLVH